MALPAHGGGVYTYRQLMQLWVAAGGSAALAPIAAAIAEAESGGNPEAQNPSGASGLWQVMVPANDQYIPGGQANVFNPADNAKAAVRIHKAQGWGAWTTYTSGAYRKFLQTGAKVASAVTGGADFVAEAAKFVGDPYVWGGESPAGFDCSGLVQYVAQKMGLKNVPRTSEQQWNYVKHIERKDLQPGDLVFSQWPGDNASPGHVQIYAGNGMVIGADSTDVEKVPLGSDAGHIVGYGRLPGIGGASGGSGAGTSSGTIELTDVPGWASEIPVIGPGLQIVSNVASLTGISGAFSTFSNNLARIEHGIEWFFVPNHWVRIFCGIAGTGLVLFGVVTMTRTGRAYSVASPVAGVSVEGVSAPSRIPAPGGELAPAIGIAEVTIGAILLFVAFHNLEADGVNNWPSLLNYFQQKLQSGGKQAE